MQKLLPPLLFVLLLAGLAVLYRYHPEGLTMRPDRAMPWDVPLAIGLVLLIAARVQFHRSQSEIMTFASPRNLVTDGAYRFSRNPMYLGFLLLVLAAAFYVNTWCALAAPLVFFLAAHFWYIPFEEQAAADTFGAPYEAYARKVRRWL